MAYYQSLAAPKAIPIALEVLPVALPRCGWTASPPPPSWRISQQRREVAAPGGRVVVRLRRDGDGVTVADDGPGLSPEDQARLFQRGARLTPRPTAGEPSTGYGLAVAKDLAARLGGELWCDSVLDQGCVFPRACPWPARREGQGMP